MQPPFPKNITWLRICIVSFLLTMAALLFFAIGTSAQTPAVTLRKTLDESRKRIAGPKGDRSPVLMKKAAASDEAILQSALEQGLRDLEKGIEEERARNEKINRQFEQDYPSNPVGSNPNRTIGETDFIPYLEDVPTPLISLPLAGQTDIEARYDPYIDKIKRQQEQLSALAKKSSKMQDVYQREGQAGLEKKAAAEVNQNELIQQMGGVENIQKMSEAERKVAAAKAVNAMKDQRTNQSMAGELIKKISTDKEYAARFNAMSDAEKQVEMKKYMNTDAYVRPVSGSASNAAKPGETFRNIRQRTTNNLNNVNVSYIKIATAVEDAIEKMRNAIHDWSEATGKSIPIVELGEAGHGADPQQLRALDETRKMAYYMLAKKEASLRERCWNQYRSGCKAAMAELNAFAGNYSWGQGSEDRLFDGSYTEPEVVSAIHAMYALMIDIARKSESISSSASGAQKSYDGRIN